jgi:membrane-bound serine protease (ClpP class)
MTRRLLAGMLLALLILVFGPPESHRLARGQEVDETPGQFFLVEQPLTSEATERLQAATLPLINRDARLGKEPVLFFEIRPGASSYGAANDLATFLSTRLGGAKQTVAYMPESLSGFGLLAALACGEIVIGPDASLGPITPEGQAPDPSHREFVRILAQRTGRNEVLDLLLGMLDPDADLKLVRTADGRWQYALPERAAQLGVVESRPAWEAGRRGVLTPDRARTVLARLIAQDRAEVARVYGVRGLSDDPTLGKELKPVWIRVDGPIDSVKESFLRRRIAQARQENVNLILFQFNTIGGEYEAADGFADQILQLRDIKSVAFIDDRALGVAVLPVLACDEIVFVEGGQMGLGNEIVSGWGGSRTEPMDPKLVAPAARKAADLARRKGHPDAFAYALVEPDSVVVEAKDAHIGAPVIVLEEVAQADPRRYLDPVVRKRAGKPLLVTSDEAVNYRLARAVVPDASEFQALYGLRGQIIRAEGANWVDALVTTLNTPWMKGTLLFLGLFMLILELKLPGIGLPAILSALSFLLYFWSSYLSGTADQLEIMLFLVGLICLALELFVFPGFGVFGMSGILLVLVSVVMASHTFIWPTSEYEYKQLGRTLIQLALALVAVGAGAMVVGRYLPSIPLLSRLVLKPETAAGGDPTAKPSLSEEAPLSFLMGETGRTTTVLRPAGKARFGELLVDVIADGDYIDPNQLIEVIEVQGNRVIVKRL